MFAVVGGVTDELAAQVIRKTFYGDKNDNELTEAEKQNISALAQLATGLAIAVAGGDVGDAGTAIAAGKNSVENNYLDFGLVIVNAAKAGCNGDKACEDKVIDEGIKGYNETMFEYGTPIVIVVGGVIAAPIAIDIVGPAIVSCSANPILCANNVATWLIETVGFEGNPAAGFGMTASVFANSLSKAELNDLAAIMELYKNNLIENPSALLNEIRTTLSENGAYKIVYDRANNTIIKQFNAGNGTTGNNSLLANANKELEQYVASFANSKYKPATAIAAVDPLTGKVVTASSGTVPTTIAPELQAYADKLGGLGVKTSCGNVLGACAEFRAANELLLNNPNLKLKDIQFTQAVRPRNGKKVPRCENCTNVFGVEK